MSGPDSVDAVLVKNPFESLKRAAKDRKGVIDEAVESVTQLQAGSSGNKEQQRQRLDDLVTKLQGLKRRMKDISKAEKQEASRCKARLSHLQELGQPSKDNVIEWNKHRLDRVLVDHLLRSGHYETASQLSKELAIDDLTELHIFQSAKRVVDALKKHRCTEALAWCAEHKARLKKFKSRLEFRLRVQEFIELVREDRRTEAIHYARQHLAPWAPLYLPELQRAVATLAFTAKTTCSTYAALFSEQQWQDLGSLFYQDLYRLHGLPSDSGLTAHLQAGLAALNTPLSYQPSCGREDPLHLPAFQKLATGLPYAKHVQSKLICSVTRQVMNEANPPMVLPNGYVYSEKAVEQIRGANAGKVVCPKTGNAYHVDELRRAYVL